MFECPFKKIMNPFKLLFSCNFCADFIIEKDFCLLLWYFQILANSKKGAPLCAACETLKLVLQCLLTL